METFYPMRQLVLSTRQGAHSNDKDQQENTIPFQSNYHLENVTLESLKRNQFTEEQGAWYLFFGAY